MADRVRTPVYLAWMNMKSRCLNKNRPGYGRYGGRGITVCEKWMSFAGFAEDMASNFRPGLTLDRINNDRNYTKENCRWATKTEQANNRSTNRRITIGGIVRTFEEWVKLSGLKSSTVHQRFYGYQWPIERALTEEVRFG